MTIRLCRILPLLIALSLCLAGPACASDAPSYVSRPDAWLTSAQGRNVIDHILSWQGHGPGGVMGWPKAYNADLPRPADGGGIEWEGIATIDNGATYSELRILARAVTLETDAARREKIRAAFDKGFDALLAAQYDNGGWPQRFPRPNNYGRHITFNDNAMVRVLELLRDAAGARPPFAFVEEETRRRARASFDRGVDCILKCQIIIDGKLTAWCAQHDEVTLLPAAARSYELPSISGSEGAAIALFLMTLEDPDDRVRKAIDAAAEWFDKARITGKRVVSINGDRVLQDDPASTLWARFYGLQTGKPIFAGRDGIKKDNLADIEQERRTGYSWYGNWGAGVARQYAQWQRRTAPSTSAPATTPPPQ